MPYLTIIKKALLITWREKKLWLLGILIFFFGGMGEVIINFFRSILSTPLFTKEGFQNFITFLISQPTASLPPLLLLIFIPIIFFLLFIIAAIFQGALVQIISQVHHGKPFIIKKEIRSAKKFFLPILGINILTSIALFATTLLIYSFLNSPLILIFILTVIAILLISTITFLGKFAVCAIVLRKKKFLSALKDSLNLSFRFYGNNVLFFLIMLACYLVLGIIGALLIILVVLPFLSIIIASFLLHLNIFLWINIFLMFLGVFALMMLLVGITAVFSWASWVSLFHSIEEK